MKKTDYCALHIDYQTFEKTWSKNLEVSIPISDSLAFTRSGSFFTSALVVCEKKEHVLLMHDAHYERLLLSYQQLYERPFNLTKEAYDSSIADVVQTNLKNGIEAPYQLLVYGLGGKADSFGGYNSGLSGDLSKIVFVTNPLASKPEWTFSSGVHLLSFATQRPLADAKPTNYVSGIKAQIAVNAINADILKTVSEARTPDIELVTQETIAFYLSLSEQEKCEFRRTRNIFRSEKQAFMHSESQWYEHLVHDTVFKTADDYILEGPTFSIFGITQQNELQFVPLKGNGTQSDDQNIGKILHSTSIQYIQKCANELNISTIQKPLHYTDIWNLKGLFAVSVTRLNILNELTELQPVKAIDGKYVPKISQTDPFFIKLCAGLSLKTHSN